MVQRYADAPSAYLLVPTLPAFAASKTSTWADRRAAHDLWDLWALNAISAIDSAAVDLFRRYGRTNQPPADHMFKTAPTDTEWSAQLAGQTRIAISAADALTTVRAAWARAIRVTATDGYPQKA